MLLKFMFHMYVKILVAVIFQMNSIYVKCVFSQEDEVMEMCFDAEKSFFACLQVYKCSAHERQRFISTCVSRQHQLFTAV